MDNYKEAITSVSIIKDNKLLMVQEAQEHCYGKWNLPGGHVDYAENLTDATIREVFEETGFQIRLISFIKILNFLSSKRSHYLGFLFQAEILRGKIKFPREEILDVRFIPLEDINKLPLRKPEMVNLALLANQTQQYYPLSVIEDEL